LNVFVAFLFIALAVFDVPDEIHWLVPNSDENIQNWSVRPTELKDVKGKKTPRSKHCAFLAHTEVQPGPIQKIAARH